VSWRDPERLGLFTEAVAKLAPRLRAELPSAVFILHRARIDSSQPWVEKRMGGLGDADLVAAQTAALDRYHDVLEQAFGERLLVVEVPAGLSGTPGVEPSGLPSLTSPYGEYLVNTLDALLRSHSGVSGPAVTSLIDP
jgi:hypothetical protein